MGKFHPSQTPRVLCGWGEITVHTVVLSDTKTLKFSAAGNLWQFCSAEMPLQGPQDLSNEQYKKMCHLGEVLWKNLLIIFPYSGRIPFHAQCASDPQIPERRSNGGCLIHVFRYLLNHNGQAASKTT